MYNNLTFLGSVNIMERHCTFNYFFLVTLTFNNVSERSRSNAKKKINFTLRQFFVAWKKVSATPLILIEFYRHVRKYIL